MGRMYGQPPDWRGRPDLVPSDVIRMGQKKRDKASSRGCNGPGYTIKYVMEKKVREGRQIIWTKKEWRDVCKCGRFH